MSLLSKPRVLTWNYSALLVISNTPNDIGPGVYDIHSPRVPAAEEIEHLLRKALQVVPKERLWVNPDCGLKNARLARNNCGIKSDG